MRLSNLLLTLARFFLPPALIGTVYIYLFPAILQCSFPPARQAEAACLRDGRPYASAEVAPFRLLALGDPQLEGDTSLPAALAWPSVERVRQDGVRQVGWELLSQGLPRWLQGIRKRVDLWGNDLYLAHVYRSVKWWTQPTHTVVLGDLLGSQWIRDEEFRRRSSRFWNKVFRGSEKVPKEVTDFSGRVEVLGQDARWGRRMMAVAGNHDIGYAGDIDEHRIERFEDAFGNVNWDIRFRLNDSTAPAPERANSFFSSNALTSTPPELRLVLLNSMNLDEPAFKPELRQQSLDFLASELSAPSPKNSATILLTHIPLHKEAGVCEDAPFVQYFPADQGGGIREQNHLSRDMSAYILNGLVGNNDNSSQRRTAIVLNGHDHEGCDTYHFFDSSPFESEDEETSPAHAVEKEQQGWQATPYSYSHPYRSPANPTVPGLREITVRSMMGSYSGYTGLFSAWFDKGSGEWKFEHGTCMLGVQHIWWGVHVLDLVVLLMGVSGVVLLVREELAERRLEAERQKEVMMSKKND